jgi:Tol biopolymer transport system component
MSVFFSFFLIFFSLLFHSALAHGQMESFYIDPVDPTQVIRTQVPFSSEVLLMIQDLPKSSSVHPAVFFENKKFTYVVPSPDRQDLAFCVDAQVHDWTGVVHLADGRVRQVGLSFEAEAIQPVFSEDGRFLVLEERQSQSRNALEVYDLETGNQCHLDGRMARDKFLNFFEPWFSPHGERMYFKVEYNNGYRKSLGLRSKQFPVRIGEASSDCGKVRYYSVAEFMEKYPDQSHYSEMAYQKVKGE